MTGIGERGGGGGAKTVFGGGGESHPPLLSVSPPPCGHGMVVRRRKAVPSRTTQKVSHFLGLGALGRHGRRGGRARSRFAHKGRKSPGPRFSQCRISLCGMAFEQGMVGGPKCHLFRGHPDAFSCLPLHISIVGSACVRAIKREREEDEFRRKLEGKGGG